MMMEIKYEINEHWLFVPKQNTLTLIDNHEKVVLLGANETRLLCFLLENRHRTLTRKELISVLWNHRDIYVDDSSLTQSVSTLRKALGDSTKLPRFIKTVPKLGYEFIASISDVSEQTQEPEIEELSALLPTHSVIKSQVARGVTSPDYHLLYSHLLRFEVFVVVFIIALIIGLNLWSV